MESALRSVTSARDVGPQVTELPQLVVGQDINTRSAANENSAIDRSCLEFWESEATRPAHKFGSAEKPAPFNAGLEAYLDRCLAHPYLPQEEIKRQKLVRIKQLVELAYNEIPVYRDKYIAAGFSPADLKTYEDIQKIPVITKPELIAAFPDRCSIGLAALVRLCAVLMIPTCENACG